MGVVIGDCTPFPPRGFSYSASALSCSRALRNLSHTTVVEFLDNSGCYGLKECVEKSFKGWLPLFELAHAYILRGMPECYIGTLNPFSSSKAEMAIPAVIVSLVGPTRMQAIGSLSVALTGMSLT